ncbi:hypothetical protein ME793_08240 [Lactobacillus delbrueckii]|nr:hypothetical protein ME793_08240 [Lactobacillus delbrueckii]GHN46113.1 hypothetical protein ME798_16430 [Lactobacillus delbrueckii]GHN57198.1 hypothetical protein ME804_12380 [Lactobacillus delbrueckii]
MPAVPTKEPCLARGTSSMTGKVLDSMQITPPMTEAVPAAMIKLLNLKLRCR